MQSQDFRDIEFTFLCCALQVLYQLQMTVKVKVKNTLILRLPRAKTLNHTLKVSITCSIAIDKNLQVYLQLGQCRAN